MRGAVVGSGPNGLAAAITLAQAGLEVMVYEAQSEPGGATRTAQTTLAGFHHDLGSSIHPMAAASPLFQSLELQRHGLEWLHSRAVLAHPLDDGTAVMLYRDLHTTCENLGRDAQAYENLVGFVAANWDRLQAELLGPLHPPRHPASFARFGLSAATPASILARTCFRGQRARALFAGLAAHSIVPLHYVLSSAVALVLAAVGHKFGWPFPRGGARSIPQSLIRCLNEFGGRVECNRAIASVGPLLDREAVLCDVTPRQLTAIAGDQLPPDYRQRLGRYQYGPGVFKVDWALSQPIPWMARECNEAATVHLGGTLEEIEDSEQAPWEKRRCDKPFVLLAQTSLFDPTRAPAGMHTAWAYCHVSNGSPESMLEAIENQIERFAPGFRDCVLARRPWDTGAMEAWNGNLVGGDVGGGAMTWKQLLFRPTLSQYRTPVPNLFLCSSSTPPGGGVHGMCGYHAASKALRSLGLRAAAL